VPVNFQVVEQLLEYAKVLGRQFLTGFRYAEKNLVVFPSREGESVEPQNNLSGEHRGVESDPRGRQGRDAFKLGARAIEQQLRFAQRDKPGRNIGQRGRIDLSQNFARTIVFMNFDGDFWIYCRQQMSDLRNHWVG
jgi:hypothetical protein